MPAFVDGHLSVPFVHVCPGKGCAVRAWIEDLLNRRAYESLQRKERTSP